MLTCCCCFLGKTGFDRECFERNLGVPGGILVNRFATFFFGRGLSCRLPGKRRYISEIPILYAILEEVSWI
ncbi:hypothetical protein PITC_007690 [Penicillium italicum]|uniref:Uncharacterized protein n=1 Tax=Penicillium italicum TaxID=40296 RepID=A0A0A2KFJ8_PENIT|nr:hypothetical protein PITC_007690 [Penicillium italicum]